jgi:hypothetical protein
MGGRSPTTIKAQVLAIKMAVINCSRLQKTPTIPPQGPMPLLDRVGMGMAVNMLYSSITAKHWLRGQAFIKFDSVQKARGTFLSTWESTPARIMEGATFAFGAMTVTITHCPTQQRWFHLFLRGAENQMGYVHEQNEPLGLGVVAKLLEYVELEMEEHKRHIQKEFLKF